MTVSSLPERPDLTQLKNQAKELLRAIRAGDVAAVATLRKHHPERPAPQDVRLADAQLVVARTYGAPSWPQLVVACRLIKAASEDDFQTIREVFEAHPELQRAGPERGATAWLSSLRNTADAALRRLVSSMQGRGATSIADVVARADLRPALDNLRLLGRVGARFPRHALGGAVETLRGEDFELMLDIGTDTLDGDDNWLSLVALALETYARNPDGKHRILNAMHAGGVTLPDTPPMAVHRGRIDLLESHLRRDPGMLTRTFTHDEIWPRALGCHEDHSLALHGAPLDGATLLHIAVDYEEEEIAEWLLDAGMDPDVRADIDTDGFGGHTPLFNCIVTYNAGLRTDRLARLLLERGADPNARASIRKGLAFARDKSVHEYRDVTPIDWARRFHDPSYVSKPSVVVTEEFGGQPSGEPDDRKTPQASPQELAMHADTKKYNAAQEPHDRAICQLLAEHIDRNLPEAENKVWHGHPVWFLDGNPIVGYSKLKGCVRLLFWSGQSFEEDGLEKEGKFRAAEARYTAADQVDTDDLRRWLAKARDIQWDYKNLVRRKGRLERLK